MVVVVSAIFGDTLFTSFPSSFQYPVTANRVPTPPEKCWDCVCKISTSRKVLESPGNLSARSCKVVEFAGQ